MSQMPLTLARSLLERAGYSVRKSQARQERVIVARDGLIFSFVVLNGCLAQERVAQLLEPVPRASVLAAAQPAMRVRLSEPRLSPSI